MHIPRTGFSWNLALECNTAGQKKTVVGHRAGGGRKLLTYTLLLSVSMKIVPWGDSTLTLVTVTKFNYKQAKQLPTCGALWGSK